MKLTGCEVFVIGNPPPRKGGRYFIVVQLTTACGITGVGEVYAASFGPKVVEAMIADMFARQFEGADPRDVERLFRRAYSAGYHQRPDPTVMGVFSGLETACWDIAGKAADMPVHRMLGGRCRERIRSYTYLYPDGVDAHAAGERSVYNDPDMAAERALQYVEQGFTAVKFDPAGPYTIYDGRQPDLETLERSALFCRRIREAVGTRADMLFGTHGQFTVSGAKRLAKRIEPWEPLWFEEPVPPEMPERMAEVAAHTSIPVATGERLATKYEFARVLACSAASILQPALGRVGGILEFRKIAAMAEAHYALMAPHLYCGPVEAAANIQVAASIPNFLVLESIERFDGFQSRLVKGIEWQDGYVTVTDRPGLGIEFDAELARAHPWEGTELHLDMTREPREP